MTSALTFRALSALPPVLQEMARQHARQHPADELGELVSEIAAALLELDDKAADPALVFSRARSRLRRATQDPAHYSVTLGDAHHDIERDAEPTPARRADIVREIAQQRRVSVRRAQQLVKSQIERAMQGDLFIADEIAGGAV